MGTTLRALGPLEWELTVTLDGDQLDAEVARRLGELVPRARIPGFRPGKAPREVLRRHYGARLRQEQWQRMAHSEVRRELATRQLHPVTAPRLEPRENNGVCARFEVFPTLPELRFEQLAIERPIVEIGEADVDCLIDRLRADPSAADVEPSTLRAELAALMVAQAEEAVEEELALAVEIALLEAHPALELPTTLLAAQVERLRGRDHGSGDTAGERATIELAARQLLSSTLLLAEASRQLGVRLDPTGLWKETEKLAARTPDPRQELDRLWADGEAIQEIEEQLLRRRVVAAILERAHVEPVPVSFTALAQRRRARPGSAGR
jgi:FKBP-type peptidyl-prolyl cis-trans isomerase (trigger factor)